MLRNAADAHEMLGDQLERNVAVRTSIVRVTDKVAALKLHDTFVAWYGENGSMLNVGDWNTRTTWKRINDFTPARPVGHQLLRYIDQPNGDRVLYEPDIRIDPEGMVTNPMFPTRQARIEDTARTFLTNVRRYARTAVEGWDDFEDHDCECSYGLCDQEHYLRHIEANDPILPERFLGEARRMTQVMHPDAVVAKVRKDVITWATTQLLAPAMYLADPAYKFLPPNTPTNKGVSP